MCFLRPRFLRLLYESLPAGGSRVLGGKTMDAIETTPHGVRVTCRDGSVHEGSMVVGADGAGSAVRRHLARGLSDGRLADPFTTSYLGMFGWSTWAGGDLFLPEATLREVHAGGFSIQVIPGRGIVMFMVYRRLPTRAEGGGGGVRCSKEEKEAIAGAVADVRITESVRFGDIWSRVQWSYCSGLEEGLAERWHGDRVVLLGDAVHKMTPNIGLGLNSGWQSAVILTNSLRRLLQDDPAPSTEALNRVFKEYHNSRKRGTWYAVFLSGLYTRLVAWNNPLWGFVDRHVTKLVGGDCKLLDLLIVPLIRRGATLDFLDEENFKTGSAAWAKGRTIPQWSRAAPQQPRTWNLKASSVTSKAISMLRWRFRDSEA